MKRILTFALLITISAMVAYSQLKYPCDSIPSSLRAGAKAVIRLSGEKITYVSERKVTDEVKKVITLLNDKAEGYLDIEIPYMGFSTVSGIKASAYDESGKFLWSLKSYDIMDMLDYNGPANLSDERKKAFEIPAYNYPFTIEYSYSVSYSNDYLNPINYLLTEPEVSVEESGLQCVFPAGMPFKYKSLNLKNPTDSTRVRDKIYMTWKEENIPAKRERIFAPPIIRKMPVVYNTLVNFNLKGYPGSFESWQSYGQWVGKLIEGRDMLNPEYAGKARELVGNLTSRRDKVKALYEYMQHNTRYFYIGFGIGGNQPMEANEVAKNGYGDCKALSNYMKALLKTVGIESYYTLVHSGAGQTIEPDFASDQFDHIILCVPDSKDTIWLECTSQTQPFDYLGSFTCDRDVLAVTPQGGKLMHTPSYGKQFNIINTYSEIAVYGSGDADIQMKLNQSGMSYDDLKPISELLPDNRKMWLANRIGFAAFDLNKEEYSVEKDAAIPMAHASFKFHLRDLCSKSNNRLFVSPSLLDDFPYILEDPSEIELSMSYRQHDSVRIEIPLGYTIEFLPDNSHVVSKFGSYSRSISHDGKYIYFSRKVEMNQSKYPSALYSEFLEFENEAATQDRQMLILRNSN
jgi:hypothetical protein